MKIIDHLNWRYATKRFDPKRKVSTEDIEVLQEAVRLAPTAYGLQLFKVLVVSNQEVKEKLKEASFGQRQLTDSSHVMIFCNYLKMESEFVDEYMKKKMRAENVSWESIAGYGDFIKGDLSARSQADTFNWMVHQTYLAMGHLLNACASMQIDACPMEGFDSEKYDTILGLKEKSLHASVIVPVGYRASDDSAQFLPKVRKVKEELFELIA